jgi:hypothetical protein
MTWKPDVLLLQIIEAVEKELAVALDVLQRSQEIATDCPNPLVSEHIRKVAALRSTLAALEGAVKRPASRIVH